MSTFTTIQLKTVVNAIQDKTRHASYIMSNGKRFYNGLPTADEEPEEPVDDQAEDDS